MKLLKRDHQSFGVAGALALAAVLALIVTQALTGFHDAKYGSGPHDHGDAPCVISMVGEKSQKLIPAATFIFAALIISWRIGNVEAQTERARIAIRAARPRGPPTA